MKTEELEALNKPYRIYASVLEDEALRQFTDAMKMPCTVQGALMPDAHTGYTLPIGAVIATEGRIFPSFVGYDIGCGMCALPTDFDAEKIRAARQNIFDDIYRAIPIGFSHNARDTEWVEWGLIPRTDKMQEIFSKNGLRQLGSLGGGNHFIEIAADELDRVWVVIHSGSRGIGHAAATHYMKLASGDGRAREGLFGFDVYSAEGNDYITDLDFCLEFALENRKEMMRRVECILADYSAGGGFWSGLINRNHNHAELKDGLWIHRKGATHAEVNMYGVIPGNMRDGSFIVRGKGNPDALWSSSHGAGRVLGRKEAKRVLTVDGFAKEMEGITARVTDDTLDESPAAYKSIFEVMELQKDMVEVVAHVKPIINIKG